MSQTAKLILDGKEYELPVVVGTEGEKAIDISQLRAQTGCITIDNGYANTGSCKSGITFIDGEKGILRYRGYPIEQLAEKSTFVEVAYLIIYGELPTRQQLSRFSELLTQCPPPRRHALPLRKLPHHRSPHGHPLRHDQCQ